MRRPTTSKLLLADPSCPFCVCSLKPAIIVETVDLGVEFPDELRPELAEGGSLDEALKNQSTKFVVQRARIVLGHGKRIVDQV